MKGHIVLMIILIGTDNLTTSNTLSLDTKSKIITIPIDK